MMNSSAVGPQDGYRFSPTRELFDRTAAMVAATGNPDHRHRILFYQITRKSLPYQIIKYVLLVLNIVIVATTAIIAIIVCLLPTVIYEKKLAVDHASSFFRTGNLSGHQFRANRRPEEIAHEVDTIRTIRYIILAMSALIILNQTVAVYGLFKERSFYILATTVAIGLVGQLGLFVLPASIFILITIYVIFSVSYVIILNYLNMMAKEPQQPSIRAVSCSRASSMEPSSLQRNCCCRCKNCLCNHQERRTSSVPPPHQLYQNVPTNVQGHYFGSLGRGRGQHQQQPSPAAAFQQQQQHPSNLTNPGVIYGQRTPSFNRSTSKPPLARNSASNIDDGNPAGIYIPGVRLAKDSNYGAGTTVAFERSRDSAIL